MLNVTIQVNPPWPLASEVLGELVITNTIDHPDRPEYGNYTVELGQRKGVIKDYCRADGPFTLVRMALEELGYQKED